MDTRDKIPVIFCGFLPTELFPNVLNPTLPVQQFTSNLPATSPLSVVAIRKLIQFVQWQ